jgi:hypothetical protein
MVEKGIECESDGSSVFVQCELSDLSSVWCGSVLPLPLVASIGCGHFDTCLCISVLCRGGLQTDSTDCIRTTPSPRRLEKHRVHFAGKGLVPSLPSTPHSKCVLIMYIRSRIAHKQISPCY